MKLARMMLLAGAVGLVGGGGHLFAQPAKAERGKMQAVMVEKGPSIDGTLKDALWQKCPALELGECTGKGAGPMQTAARVLFDPTTLYVAFQCAESDTGGLVQTTSERDADVWKDDCVEVFVSGDIRLGYWHFVVNPKGTLMDSRCRPPQKDDVSFNSSAAVKTALAKNQDWTVTMSVPLKEIGAYVGQNQTWTLNLNRTRPARGDAPLAEWSWAIMSSNDFHQVADFGQVTGVNVPLREDGVTRAASAAPPPPQAEKGQEAGGVTIYRRTPETSIPEGKEGTAKTIDLNIRTSKGLKVGFLARGTGGAKEVPLNMADRRANDNTTSKSYRTVDGQWKPILYYVDRFRYNGGPADGTIRNDNEFTNLRFHGNKTESGKGLLELRELAIYRGEDAEPPSPVEDLSAKVGEAGVSLSWSPAKDNVGVAMYAVSRAGDDGKFVKVGQSALPGYLDKPEKPGQYRYRVLAVDFQDNLSAWSKPASAKAAKGFEPASRPAVEQDRAGYADNVRKVHAAGAGKVGKGTVLCFGDSLTGATMYRVFVESSLGRYKVEANGRAGWTTDGCRKVIESDLKQANPQFCLILLGTNNNKSPAALPGAMDDLMFMAKACAANGTVPIIGTIPPRGFGDPQSKPEAAYNAELVKTCRENHIAIAYIFEAFQAAGDRKNLLAGDGVHLVPGGWEVTGPAWEAATREVNFVLLDRPD
jgi:hypothetical protein